MRSCSFFESTRMPLTCRTTASATATRAAASTPTPGASICTIRSAPRFGSKLQVKVYHCASSGVSPPSSWIAYRPMCPPISTSGRTGAQNMGRAKSEARPSRLPDGQGAVCDRTAHQASLSSSSPTFSRTMYRGRPFTSEKMRAIYSPWMPIPHRVKPLKNSMKTRSEA